MAWSDDGAAPFDEGGVAPVSVVLADPLPDAATREPAARCRAALAMFSGKMLDWIVQIPHR